MTFDGRIRTNGKTGPQDRGTTAPNAPARTPHGPTHPWSLPHHPAGPPVTFRVTSV